MKHLKPIILNIGIFIVAFLMLAPSVYAACGDNVNLDDAGLVSKWRVCKDKPVGDVKDQCIQAAYFPLCYANVVGNFGAEEAQRICTEETKACVQEYTDASAATNTGNTGSGNQTTTGSGGTTNTNNSSSGNNQVNCGTDFDIINGICVPRSGFGSGSLAQSKTWQELAQIVLKILLTVVGVIAVGAIVIGGYWYITSGGNEETAEKGRKVLINAIIGLIVVILAYAIVTVVTNLITTSKVN
jgi:hypothetical protein